MEDTYFFTSNLLEALNNPNVREKIMEIVKEEKGKKEKKGLLGKDNNTSDVKMLKRKLEEEVKEKERLYTILDKLKDENENSHMMLDHLKAANKSLENSNSDLERKINRLEDENRQLKSDYETQFEEYKENMGIYKKQLREQEQECNLYKGKYKLIDYYYNLYLSLGEDAHKKLGRILSAKSPELFLSWGTQWDNIRALWTEISFWLDEYPKDMVDKLIQIFDFFFGIYYENNQMDGEKKYIRQEVQTGDEFDDFLHTRKDGVVAGRITEVLLKGYGQMDGEEFILKEKSIVRI